MKIPARIKRAFIRWIIYGCPLSILSILGTCIRWSLSSVPGCLKNGNDKHGYFKSVIQSWCWIHRTFRITQNESFIFFPTITKRRHTQNLQCSAHRITYPLNSQPHFLTRKLRTISKGWDLWHISVDSSEAESLSPKLLQASSVNRNYQDEPSFCSSTFPGSPFQWEFRMRRMV